jgi:hypothetical protein
LTPTSKVVERIVAFLKQGPANFYAILKTVEDVEYPLILQAWSDVREQDILARDHEGNYVLKGAGESDGTEAAH